MSPIKKTALAITAILFLGLAALPVSNVHAQDALTGLSQFGESAYGTSQPKDVRLIVASIIRGFLGFLGIIAVLLVLYGGFKWMTSRGNDQEVDAAKKILTSAAIGLIIVVLAYAITAYVFGLLEARQAPSTTPSTPAPVSPPTAPSPGLPAPDPSPPI